MSLVTEGSIDLSHVKLEYVVVQDISARLDVDKNDERSSKKIWIKSSEKYFPKFSPPINILKCLTCKMVVSTHKYLKRYGKLTTIFCMKYSFNFVQTNFLMKQHYTFINFYNETFT